MSATTGAQSRGQLTTIIVLAVALVLSVGALVISLVQLTSEKAALNSAAGNAQVVTKEVAADSAELNGQIAQYNAAVSDVSNQANSVAKAAAGQKTDAAAQAKVNAALKDGSDKVQSEAAALGTSVQGIGTSIAAQQNASTALVTLITDVQNDPTYGITTLDKNANSLSTNLNTLVSQNCPNGGACTLSASDFNSLIALAANVSSGLTTQNEALSKTDPTVSAIAAATALNAGLTDIQKQGATATTAAKTFATDAKALGTGIAAASTSAAKLSDGAAKLSDSAAKLSTSAAAVKDTSSNVAVRAVAFNKTVQALSTGAYQPDLSELTLPTVVLVGIAGAVVLLAFLVIWMAALARRNRRA